jgi:hypothetical protein
MLNFLVWLFLTVAAVIGAAVLSLATGAPIILCLALFFAFMIAGIVRLAIRSRLNRTR